MGDTATPGMLILPEQPSLCKFVSCPGWGNSVHACESKHLKSCLVNCLYGHRTTRRVPVCQLLRAMNDATCIGHIIRNVKDSACLQGISVPVFAELVICSTANQVHAEARNRLVIQNPAKRTRREYVGLHVIYGFRHRRGRLDSGL